MEAPNEAVPEVGHPDLTESEHRRVVYLLSVLQTADDAHAREVSGLGPHARQRITHMLATRGSVHDAPRSGRPTIYTDKVMGKAVKVLVENDEGFLNGHELLLKLKDMGVLAVHADIDNFLNHLHNYVKSLGYKVTVNNTKTIFFLSAADIVKRVKFAAELLPELGPEALDMVIFIDETTLEESPHPKGAHE